MKDIDLKFKDRIIMHSGIKLLTKFDAIDFIDECEIRHIQILGIDAFYLTPNTIEPSMDNSIDFSSSTPSNFNGYSIAKNFLQSRNDSLFFEIVHR